MRSIASRRRRRSAHTRCYAQSDKDFIHKYSISLKEASETKYWIKIMIQAQIVPENKFSPMLNEIEQIIRILITIIKKLKSK